MLDKCTVKGSISSMPDIPGILVFLPGHVGVYIGNGYVIEVKGHAYGVVKTKLVRAIKGSVFDVAVDMREGSPTYLKWYGIELTEENKKQFYIPKGFLHGFLVLSDYAEFCYKCDDYYHPEDEAGVAYNDPTIGVEWPITEDMVLNLSEKDKNLKPLK